MNNCTFTGRFASAPRRHNSGETSRCYFTLMVNKDNKKADGTKFPPQAVNFVAWGNVADNICQYKDKGHLVVVTSEFATYAKEPVDMNNQPIANARKVQVPTFTVKHIEYMPSAPKNTDEHKGNQNMGGFDFEELEDPFGMGNI